MLLGPSVRAAHRLAKVLVIPFETFRGLGSLAALRGLFINTQKSPHIYNVESRMHFRSFIFGIVEWLRTIPPTSCAGARSFGEGA